MLQKFKIHLFSPFRQ